MIEDDALPQPLDAALLAQIAQLHPGADRCAAIKSRLLKRLACERAEASAAPLVTVRAADGWQELMPKIFAKRVYTDGWAESYLVRMEPGCCAPPHEHPADEECAVLEGELTIGDIHLRAGDFHIARSGSAHGATTTTRGALVMLRYAAPLSHYMKI